MDALSPPRPRKKHARRYQVGKFELSERRIKDAIASGNLPFPAHLPAVKRVRALVERWTAHLGGEVTLVEELLIRRCAVVTLLLENMEARFLVEDCKVTSFDVSSYRQIALSMFRIADRLGLARRPRDLGDLSSYLADLKAIENDPPGD